MVTNLRVCIRSPHLDDLRINTFVIVDGHTIHFFLKLWRVLISHHCDLDVTGWREGWWAQIIRLNFYLEN